MSKYTLEFKLEVINYYLSGRGGQKQAAKQFGIPRINIRTWVALYERHGKKGLIPQQRRYTGEFKCTVVEHMYLEKLSIKATATHFDILFSNVAAWDKIYHQKGKAALLNGRKGRPPIMAKTPKIKAPSKPDEQKTHAELLDEIEYLRAEVAYLKKLDALILNRPEKIGDNLT